MSNSKKIIDIISQPREDGKPHVSLEYFPPRSEEGVKNLHARMERMKNTLEPVFSDITWGAGGSTADLTMDLATHMQKTGHVCNMHMTCTNIGGEGEDPKIKIREALQTAYENGIRNIVALRGDPPAGQEEWKAAEGGFTCALDLVKFMRSETNGIETMGISVAGYPEGHPNAISEIADPSTLTASEKGRASTFDEKTYCCLDADYEKEMAYLKEKIDAGADFIITQMFFDADVFKQFVKDCRAIGITCPVVPGLMCINNYGGFVKMTKFCKTRVPADLKAKMDSIQNDAAAVKQFGIDFGAEMCTALMTKKDEADEAVPVLHFYTLNLEKVVYGVLEKLGLHEAVEAQEADNEVAQAKGSAWARVGDRVKCTYGQGLVINQDAASGMAEIELDNWIMAGGQKPKCFLQKGQYEKVF